MMENLKLLPIVIFLVVLSFSVRLSTTVVDVKDVYIEYQTAFAADKEDKDSKQDKQKESAKENTDSKAKMADEPSKDEVAEKKELPVWRDSVEQDFVFEGMRDDYVSYLETRRKVLDDKEKKLDSKEALIRAAQQEMDRKYIELSQIRKQLEILLEDQQDQEKKQIVSLVKIYEGMKAKEAAKIFNTLDLNILMRVFMNMSDRKAAAILAKMNPERAKTLTVMLAEQKSLPTL